MRNLSVLAGSAMMVLLVAFHLGIVLVAGEGAKCFFFAHGKFFQWKKYEDFVHKGMPCVVDCSLEDSPPGTTHECVWGDNYKCTYTRKGGSAMITGSCPDLGKRCIKLGEGTCGEKPPEPEPETPEPVKHEPNYNNENNDNGGIRGKADLLLLLTGLVGMAVHGGGMANIVGGFV